MGLRKFVWSLFRAGRARSDPASRTDSQVGVEAPDPSDASDASATNRSASTDPTEGVLITPDDGLLLNSRDMTERARLRHDAEHDPLTELPNRAFLIKRVRQTLDSRSAMLLIDLDRFSAVNDAVGHAAGDALLIQVARRLRDAVRHSDTVARLGGDEFAVLIAGDGTRDRAAHERDTLEFADRLRASLARPYLIDGGEIRVTASIGVALAEPGLGSAQLLRSADRALYRAKAGGEDRVELYPPEPRQDVAGVAAPNTRRPVARQDGEFVLLHQPVVALRSGRITSVAAQARWRSSRGVLYTPAGAPAVFEDSFEGAEEGTELSIWMLEKAVELAAQRATTGHVIPVAVRMSARRPLDRSIPLGLIEVLLTRHGLPSGSLIVELSDIDPRVTLDDLARHLTALSGLGVRVALGSLGRGSVSVTALRRLPVDMLTLERGVVEGMVRSAAVRNLTSDLLRFATDLGLQTVADGVDLPEQVTTLRALGCTHGQGLAFSGPLDAYRLHWALNTGGYPIPHTPAEPTVASHATRSATPTRAAFAEQGLAAGQLLRDHAPPLHDNETAAVGRAAGEFERTLAQLFVRLGPPPEPTELEHTPAGSGDGGVRR